MTDLNEKALNASCEAYDKEWLATELHSKATAAAIRTYFEAATSPDVAGLIAELEAFATGCRGSMWQSREETIRLCEQAATALRLSAGGGWRSIDSAPHGVNVLLAYWDEALGGWHMEAGMASWGWRHDGVSNMSAHGQATHWQPLPASPTVEAGHVE